MAQTIKENALEIVSANTNGFIRIVGENGLSYRVAVQDFINLVGNNQTITELIQEEALARESADNDLADEITDIKADLEYLSGVPTNVRQAILTLFESAAYTTTGLEDEIAIIESWAEEIISITLSDSTITFDGSDTHQLVATTVPAGGSVVWTTSDSSVATVSNTGLVTSIGNGEATITASSGSVSTTCEVTVSGFAVLESITAVYTQSGTVRDTDTLDDLKADLVVTANYDDSSTEIVTEYTLSGTLEVGTSTITVTYGGKTDTFDVTVSSNLLYNWDLTQSLVDTVSEREVELRGTNDAKPTRNSTGLVFDAASQNANFGSMSLVGKTIEIDVASFQFAGSTSNHIRFAMHPASATYGGYGSLLYRSNSGWQAYGKNSGSTGNTWSGNYSGLSGNTDAVRNIFNGKTVKIVFGNDSDSIEIFLDDESKGQITNVDISEYSGLVIGGGYSGWSAGNGDQCYNMTITGVRVYENEVA